MSNGFYRYVPGTDYKLLAQAKLAANADRMVEQDLDSMFLSYVCTDLTARVYELLAKLDNSDGLVEFPVLYTLQGRKANARAVFTRFGLRWALCDERGNFTGEFLPYRPRKASTLAKRGYEERLELLPAGVRLFAQGSGMSGLSTATVGYVPDYSKIYPKGSN